MKLENGEKMSNAVITVVKTIELATARKCSEQRVKGPAAALRLYRKRDVSSWPWAAGLSIPGY